MSLRVFSLLALVLAASALLVHAEHPAAPLSREARRAASDQSVSFGYLNPYDRVLATKNVYKSSTILTVNEQKVTLTLSSGLITYIRVDDVMRNGNNAAVQLKSGGPGQRAVTLKFTSKRGKAINYNITLYGR